MGTNNRQRRAAKKRKRNTKGSPNGRRPQSHGQSQRQSAASSSPTPSPGELFTAAVYAQDTGDEDVVSILVERLTALARPPVAGAIQDMLEAQLGHAWAGGWQPADLARSVSRELADAETQLLRCVLAAEAAGYEHLGTQVAPEWMGQLETLGAVRSWESHQHYLTRLDLTWPAALTSAVRLMHLLGALPRLPILTPPPANWQEGIVNHTASQLPPGLLDKVRNLLVKAESTTFDAEAEAFTAKAQQIMARHRIDRALLQATSRGPAETPVGRRLSIDDPYADAKATLIAAIADANGGHAVWSKGLGFSTVFAFTDELDGIEELFTSLLVQATAALRREGSKVDGRGRSRTTRFRRSFLTAFATRIGQRLSQAVDDTLTEARADAGDAMLPVLAASDDAVRDATERAFGELGTFSPSASDDEGWFAGTLFGDQADLGIGDTLEQRAAS